MKQIVLQIERQTGWIFPKWSHMQTFTFGWKSNKDYKRRMRSGTDPKFSIERANTNTVSVLSYQWVLLTESHLWLEFLKQKWQWLIWRDCSTESRRQKKQNTMENWNSFRERRPTRITGTFMKRHKWVRCDLSICENTNCLVHDMLVMTMRNTAVQKNLCTETWKTT